MLFLSNVRSLSSCAIVHLFHVGYHVYEHQNVGLALLYVNRLFTLYVFLLSMLYCRHVKSLPPDGMKILEYGEKAWQVAMTGEQIWKCMERMLASLVFTLSTQPLAQI